MPVLAFPTDPAPEEPMERSFEPTMEIIRYGEGYTQRFVHGINANINTYTLRYTNLTQTERDTLVNFLTGVDPARGVGDAFTYQFIHESAPRKFIAPEGFEEVEHNGPFYDITVPIEEVRDL